MCPIRSFEWTPNDIGESARLAAEVCQGSQRARTFRDAFLAAGALLRGGVAARVAVPPARDLACAHQQAQVTRVRRLPTGCSSGASRPCIMWRRCKLPTRRCRCGQQQAGEACNRLNHEARQRVCSQHVGLTSADPLDWQAGSSNEPCLQSTGQASFEDKCLCSGPSTRQSAKSCVHVSARDPAQRT